jgi:hypothetical protein
MLKMLERMEHENNKMGGDVIKPQISLSDTEFDKF